MLVRAYTLRILDHERFVEMELLDERRMAGIELHLNVYCSELFIDLMKLKDIKGVKDRLSSIILDWFLEHRLFDCCLLKLRMLG
jgi:hypothetical protein